MEGHVYLDGMEGNTTSSRFFPPLASRNLSCEPRCKESQHQTTAKPRGSLGNQTWPQHSASTETAWWLLGTSVSCRELLGPLSCTRQARACLKDAFVSCPFPKKGPQPYQKTMSPPSPCLWTAEICLIACGWFSSSFPAVKLHYRQLKIHHILS